MTAFANSRTKALDASPPVFASPVLDRLTRVHPAVPCLIYLPGVLVLAVVAAHRTTGFTAIGLFPAGYLVWTLAEYWAHRVVFHWVPPGRWGQRLHWMAHGIHHEHPSDPLRLVFPPLASLPVAAGVLVLFLELLGLGAGCGAAAGFFTGYVVYEAVHFHIHHHHPSTRLGKALRRRHMQHHFRDDERGFGVSCPYWDHAFGTAPRTRTSA